MNGLIGKKITGIKVSDDQSLLSFFTESEVISYQACGDCCSETWFADLIGVTSLIGSTVSLVEKLVFESCPMCHKDLIRTPTSNGPLQGYSCDDGRGRQDSDQAYGYSLISTRGRTTVIFRNSSNGYYGGEIVLYNGDLPQNMIEITDDWQA